jgi:hypothetical protein
LQSLFLCPFLKGLVLFVRVPSEIGVSCVFKRFNF